MVLSPHLPSSSRCGGTAHQGLLVKTLAQSAQVVVRSVAVAQVRRLLLAPPGEGRGGGGGGGGGGQGPVGHEHFLSERGTGTNWVGNGTKLWTN